jgi:phospholipid/cholesterol/gamma-HCH transport system substrate-binding protein
MQRPTVELSVGTFVLLGLACLAYLSLQLGEFELARDDRKPVTARFTSASGLREGAYVEVGGVRAGTVHRIALDPTTYEAVVEMYLDANVALQSDTIASIRTAGLIGDKFVKLAPGGADDLIAAGGEILETEPSISLEELISKYIFEGQSKSSDATSTP